jgi:hypothetical protein
MKAAEIFTAPVGRGICKPAFFSATIIKLVQVAR